MPDYLNLNVVLRYDFIVTYLAIMFFVNSILAVFQLNRLNLVFWRVWENRNRLIHRTTRSQQIQKSSNE